MKLDCNDLLGSFMGDKKGLTDEQIADNIIGVIFAARDTSRFLKQPLDWMPCEWHHQAVALHEDCFSLSKLK